MSDVIDPYREQFRRLQGAGTGASWLAPFRDQAFERFASRGFPSTNEEEFRFTNLSALTRTAFALPGEPSHGAGDISAQISGLSQLDGTRLVFVDGRLDMDASRLGEIPSGLVVLAMGEALSKHRDRLQPIVERDWGDEETVFRALNQAFIGEGAFILIPRDVALSQPIHLLFLASASASPSAGAATMSHPFNVIVAEPGSSATILESYHGPDDGQYLTNVVTEIVAEDNAHVDHYKLQREGRRAFHTSWLSASQSRDASVSNHSIALGARLARNDIRTELSGQGASCQLNGLYVLQGDQLVDHHTVIDHESAHCTSRELYKGVLDDASRAVFNGRIIVRPDAQKTDSEQSNKNLLLSKEALVNSNPQLEIHADDVKCAHGATIGQLSPEAMFYLRSRGIGEARARHILTQGFINDVNQKLKISALRQELQRILFGAADTSPSSGGSSVGGDPKGDR